MAEKVSRTQVDIDTAFETLLVLGAGIAVGKLDVSKAVADYVEELIPSLSSSCLNKILRVTHDASFMKHEVNSLYKNINTELRERKLRGYDHVTLSDIEDKEDEEQ